MSARLSRRDVLKAGSALAASAVGMQAKQQYYVYAPSGVYIGVWDAAVKNYVSNLGYDWGGRLLAAWLDR